MTLRITCAVCGVSARWHWASRNELRGGYDVNVKCHGKSQELHLPPGTEELIAFADVPLRRLQSPFPFPPKL